MLFGESFYRCLEQEISSKRVTLGNLDQAQLCLSRVFDAELAKQAQVEGVRYLPLFVYGTCSGKSLEADVG